MALSVKDALASKGVRPSDAHLDKLESKWSEVLERRSDLSGVSLDDADIAVRNLPGGDHVR